MFVEIIRLVLQQNTPPVFLLNCNNIVHIFIPCPNCCTPGYFQLKGQSQEIFCSRIFHESSSPKPQKIAKGNFNFLKIFGDISKSRCITSINDTGGKFARGVNNNGSKFVACVNYCTLVANLPPVSTTLAVNLPPASMTPVANNDNNIRLIRLLTP
jgi:hypothetical protein